LIRIDEDGVIRSCNPAAERMFGYDAAQVIGRNVAAHELNQPLTAIINYAQTARGLVERRYGEAAGGLVSLLEKTVQQASRAGQIIRRLRQFIAKGETDRALEDIIAVVEDAGALALIGTGGKGIAARAR
jgi:two-component system, LuxR family, sensor kinase FixL